MTSSIAYPELVTSEAPLAGSRRLGDWAVTAVASPGDPEHPPHAHLRRGAERVRLRYCHAELAVFMAAMERIEAEFDRRCRALHHVLAETVRPSAAATAARRLPSQPQQGRHA